MGWEWRRAIFTRLILIEGIPGSGKTTFARRIADWYQTRGGAANLFLEGQSHPADLGWCACIPAGMYGQLVQKYALLRSQIEEHTVFEGGIAIVAYTLVKTDNRDFYKELSAYEVYDARVADDVFYNLHYERWRAFGQGASHSNALNIFECAFLQNHVNELLFWRDAGEDAIIAHHLKLINSVAQLSPALIYLSQPDIRETIARIARERVSEDHGNWIDGCINYCENSTFGKRRGIKGFDGAMEFFAIRKQLEMKIMAQLPIPKIIIENSEYDWDGVWSQIEKCLSAWFGA